MCGEKKRTLTDKELAEGSPPHVRGKDTVYRHRTSSTRITPACAGKSVRGEVKAPVRGDHPRMCGEKRCRAKNPYCR